MQCPRCFTVLPDDACFCYKCGLEIQPGTAAVQDSALSSAKPKRRIADKLFYPVAAAAAVLAVVLGITLGRLLAAPSSQVNTVSPTPEVLEPTPEMTVSTPEPEATPAPDFAVVTPSPVYADAGTLLAQFREIRGIIRNQCPDEVKGPLVLIPEEIREERYEQIADALSALGYVSGCFSETGELEISTDSGLFISLGTDGYISLVNCPELFAGNAICEYISLPGVISGSDLSSDSGFASALDSILLGDIGLYSYSAPESPLYVPIGRSSSLKSLCYFRVDSTGNIYSCSGGVLYASAVYNTLWGETPLSTEPEDYANTVLIATMSAKISPQQLYTAFTERGVVPGALLVSSPTYSNGDTILGAAILLGYDGSGIDVLYVKDGNVLIQRSDWANFSYIFGPESYLQAVYQPNAELLRSRFPSLKSPEFDPDAAVFNPDPATLNSPKIAVSGLNSPLNVLYGSNFNVYGNLSVEDGAITNVTVVISDANGNLRQNLTVTPEEGCKLFSIYNNFNGRLNFPWLEIGRYSYVVTVTAQNGPIEVTREIVNAAFYIYS